MSRGRHSRALYTDSDDEGPAPMKMPEPPAESGGPSLSESWGGLWSGLEK